MSQHVFRLAAVAACLCAPQAFAQDAQAPVSGIPVVPPAAQPVTAPFTLPSGTRLLVTTNDALSTATNHVGDRFEVTVLEDVVDRGTVVIPRGTTGYGEVTFATRKGGFGKQGILGIALRYLELNGRMVALDGRYREEGRSNDGAAAATMFAVGVFAFVVKGKNSVIPKGRILRARTGEDIAFTIGALPGASAPAGIESTETAPAAVIVPAAAPVQAPQSTPN